MGKFDLSKLDGVFGVGLLGGVISCFIVYMVCNIVSKIPASLPEVVETALMIGFYTMLTGVIILAVGCLLLLSNALRTRKSENEGTPTWHILLEGCLVGVTILISFLIPELIF